MDIKKQQQKHKYITMHCDKEKENNDEYMNYVHQKIIGDATHGSLALKAYQQNLYLKYYY